MNVAEVWQWGGKQQEGLLQVAWVLAAIWPSSVTSPGFCVHPSSIAALKHVIPAAVAAFGLKQSGSVQMTHWCLSFR